MKNPLASLESFMQSWTKGGKLLAEDGGEETGLSKEITGELE
jgi:hypothetical protein